MKQSINEWQDLSLKKDVEKIRQELQKSKKYEKPIIIEILTVVITILLDRFYDIFSKCELAKLIIYCVLIFVAGFTLVYLFCSLLKEFFELKSRIKTSTVKIKSYVDTFDNNVCYFALTACNFYENLLQITDELNKTDNLKEKDRERERESFFFIETNYYINKCIAELYGMENVIQNVFTDNPENVIHNSSIHFSRLKNIVDLMFEIRNSLYTMNSIKQFAETKIVAEKYDRVMQSFVSRTNELKLFKDTLSWL